jgi:hypothetical protein
MRGPLLAVALAVAVAVPLAAFGGSDRADLALVLALDVSGSVDDTRFKLQREDIAAALESEELAAAVSMGVNRTIEVAIIEWAEEQRLVVPWTVLRRRGDLAALASRIRGAGRSWVHTMTDPGGGIAAADNLFAAEPVPADRRGDRRVRRRKTEHRRVGNSGGEGCGGFAWGHRKRPADHLR